MTIVLQFGHRGATFFAAPIVVQPPLSVVLGYNDIMAYRCSAHVVHTRDQTVTDFIKMDRKRWFDGVTQNVRSISSTILSRGPAFEMDNESSRQGFESESSCRCRTSLTVLAASYLVMKSGSLRHTLW